MPYRRKRRTGRRRRYGNQRKVAYGSSRKYASNVLVHQPKFGYMPNGGLPEALFTKFVYSDTITITDNGVAGSASYYQYRLNSIFDPDYTNGTGENGQPYMRDQLTAFYKYAVIYACKVEICVMGGGSATIPHTISIRPTLQSSAPTDWHLENERPWSKRACLGIGTDRATLKAYYPMHKLLGVKKSSMENSDYRISIGSSPNTVVYLNIVQSPIPESTSTSTETYYYAVRLSYYTKLYQTNDQIAS